MLYAPTTNKGDIPMEWDAVENLARYVMKTGAGGLGYKFNWERNLFAGSGLPLFRLHIQKWIRDARGTYPTTVLITDDPQMAESALRMLLITVQDEIKQLNVLYDNATR